MAKKKVFKCKRCGKDYSSKDVEVLSKGFKGRLRVRGLGQIPQNAEITNAHLIQKSSGYYIAITCFVPKEQRQLTGKSVGYDFGIATHITDSNGNKHKWCFEQSKRHKRLQRKVNKTYKHGQKSSKNREHRKYLCRLEHEKLSNRKKDAIKKFVSKSKNNYDFVAIQNESLVAWKSSRMKGWGRIVHHSVMGGIISGLKKLPQMVIIDKWESTTQECLICGKKTKHELSERVYKCPHCGYSQDRDVHSAQVVLKKAVVHADRMELKPVESGATTHQLPMIVIDEQTFSMKQETTAL